MCARGIRGDKATYWIFLSREREESKEASLGDRKINHAVN